MIHEVNVPITKIYSARNDDDEIDRLVSEYLLNGTGYDELFERVLHRLSCANRLAFMHDDGFEHYYISEDGRLDFSPYTIYCTYEHNSFGYYIASYERVKYCNIESYSEFVANAKRVFTEDYVNRSILGMYRDTPTVISCNDQIYTLWGGAGSPPLDDFNCKMLVAEDVILIHITCYEYYGGEKGLEYNLNYILTRFDEGWRFDSTNDMLQGYGQYLYNILVNQTQ